MSKARVSVSNTAELQWDGLTLKLDAHAFLVLNVALGRMSDGADSAIFFKRRADYEEIAGWRSIQPCLNSTKLIGLGIR